MKKANLLMVPFLMVLTLLWACCKTDDPGKPEPSGKLIFNFLHYCDGSPMIFDTTMYVNEAGNPYQVNEIQYFITDITLHAADGKKVVLNKENDIYYVDTDLPGTHKWQVADPVPAGTYTGVSFTFGIPQAKNQSFMYVNPPESNMVWPEFLGGGYHYMKLNGKYVDSVLRPFNFHLGIGQIYPPNSHNYDSIIAFVHNDFEAILPNSGFTITKDQVINFDIVMNIDEWFKDPHTWDHKLMGNYTMENQDAMQKMKENGYNVFTAGTIR
ncbi:MAG TPA: hypothetical protein P5228_06435 [Bacteroidales bacterium]|nr:hypothetical protein [Bacteroidales bacterium]HRZ50274.1 hypothetical protein [Bacteroidales bacterium]